MEVQYEDPEFDICPHCHQTHFGSCGCTQALLDDKRTIGASKAFGVTYAKTSKPASTELGLKFDSGKPRYSLIPPIALKALADVLTFGADKYAPNSWQTVPNGEQRYLDALFRHIEAYRNGEQVDPESKLSHLAHAITNVAFLLHFEKERS